MDEKTMRGNGVGTSMAGLTETSLTLHGLGAPELRHVPAGVKRQRTLRRDTAWLLGCLLVAGAVGLPAPTAARDMKPDTLERVKRAAVLVFTAASRSQKGDQKLGSGSGFFINSTGLAITNNHVVDPTHKKSPEEKQRFHYQTGRLTWTVVKDAGTDDEETYEAVVLYQNESADQALLQVYDEDEEKLETLDYLRLLPESRLRKRMKVWALGFPGGDRQSTSRDKHPEVSVTNGHVLDLPRTPAGRVRMVYTDVIARPGNSGGPMVDIDGLLLGTVTLMSKPEGREDTGGASYSALVPAKLTGEMVRNAFQLGKVPEGADIKPFIEMLTDERGRINIPEFNRLPDRDILFFDDGDRIYGTIATDSITWESPLGTLKVPTSAVAYVMSDDDGSNLFLEGGNRIQASEVGSKFRFTPVGGTMVIEQSFDDVSVVGFRTGGRSLKPVTGEVVIFDSDISHLVLSNVEGTAKFESRAGPIDIALKDIARIDTRDDDRQVITLKDARRITGQFDETPFRAILAATNTPIRFNLSEVIRATVEVLRYTPEDRGGLDLLGVLASADNDILRIARALEAGEHTGARAKIDSLLEPARFRKFPTTKKEQVRLLDGITLLRAGDFGVVTKALRAATKAKDENIAAYARGCVAVLKRFKTQYDGEPLSDSAVFAGAGAELADELIEQARELLKDRHVLEGKKGEYVRSLNAIKKHEEWMQVAAVFAGVEADDELIRLWNFATEVCGREIQRLDEEIGDQGQGRRRSGQRASRRSRGRRGARNVAQRELNDLREKRDKVIETAVSYRSKLLSYGFRIEDPDIREFYEQQKEQEPQDDNGP